MFKCVVFKLNTSKLCFYTGHTATTLPKNCIKCSPAQFRRAVQVLNKYKGHIVVNPQTHGWWSGPKKRQRTGLTSEKSKYSQTLEVNNLREGQVTAKIASLLEVRQKKKKNNKWFFQYKSDGQTTTLEWPVVGLENVLYKLRKDKQIDYFNGRFKFYMSTEVQIHSGGLSIKEQKIKKETNKQKIVQSFRAFIKHIATPLNEMAAVSSEEIRQGAEYRAPPWTDEAIRVYNEVMKGTFEGFNDRSEESGTVWAQENYNMAWWRLFNQSGKYKLNIAYNGTERIGGYILQDLGPTRGDKDPDYMLQYIVVAPAYRLMGIGTYLLSHLKAGLKPGKTVALTTQGSPQFSFYEQNSFQYRWNNKDGHTRVYSYTKPPDDATLLEERDKLLRDNSLDMLRFAEENWEKTDKKQNFNRYFLLNYPYWVLRVSPQQNSDHNSLRNYRGKAERSKTGLLSSVHHYSQLPEVQKKLIDLLNKFISHGDALRLNSLHFLADQLRDQLEKGDNRLKDQLLSIVLLSRLPERETEVSSLCASNALSILNLSGVVSFAGMDFHDVRAPGAHLSKAVLHKTNLSGADLEGASLAWAYLAEADLRGANLKNVDFGEKPSLNLQYGGYHYQLQWTPKGVVFIYKNSIFSYAVDQARPIQLKKAENLYLNIFSLNTKANVAVVAGKSKVLRFYVLRFYKIQPNGEWEKNGTDCKSGNQIQKLEYNPQGTMLAAVDSYGHINIWQEQKKVKTLPARYVGNISWSPDGEKFAWSSRERKVHIWKVEKEPHLWKELQTIEGVYSNACTWSPDSKKMATVSSHHVDIFSLDEEPTLLYKLKIESKLMWLDKSYPEIMSVAWNPRNPLLAANTRCGRVIIWSLGKGKEHKQVALLSNSYQGLDKTYMDLAWNPDGTLLAWRDQNSGIHFWETKTGRREINPEGHFGTVTDLCFNEAGTHLASSSRDSTARIWNVRTGAEAKQLKSEHPLNTISWNKQKLAIGGERDSLSIYDSETWRLEQFLSQQYNPIEGVKWSPDGKLLATISSYSYDTKLWNTKEWKSLILRTSVYPPNDNTAATWGPNGKTLAVGNQYGYVETWDLDIELWEEYSFRKRSKNKKPMHIIKRNGKFYLEKLEKDPNILQPKRGEVKQVSMVSVSGKGRKALAVAQSDQITVYWDIKDKDRRLQIAQKDLTPGLCWILEGKGLVAGTRNGQILWWDINHQSRQIQSKPNITSHNAPVTSICWHGQKLACCYRDGVIQVYLFRQKEKDFVLLWRSGFKRLVLTGVQAKDNTAVTLLKQTFSS